MDPDKLKHPEILTTVKPMLSEHIKQYIILAFQTGGCFLLRESSAESSCMHEISVAYCCMKVVQKAHACMRFLLFIAA